MVPQPVWHERPVVEYDTTPTIEGPAPPPVPFSRPVSGRWWKTAHQATVRTQSKDQESKKGKGGSAWDKRQEARKRDDAVKKLEREMKADKEQEAEAKRTALKERKAAQEEKLRLQQMAEKMSAKRLQRAKKRMGRTKKINA